MGRSCCSRGLSKPGGELSPSVRCVRGGCWRYVFGVLRGGGGGHHLKSEVPKVPKVFAAYTCIVVAQYTQYRRQELARRSFVGETLLPTPGSRIPKPSYTSFAEAFALRSLRRVPASHPDSTYLHPDSTFRLINQLTLTGGWSLRCRSSRSRMRLSRSARIVRSSRSYFR